jgi:hypothetical protein
VSERARSPDALSLIAGAWRTPLVASAHAEDAGVALAERRAVVENRTINPDTCRAIEKKVRARRQNRPARVLP